MNSSIIIYCITIFPGSSLQAGQAFLALTNIIISVEHGSSSVAVVAEARPKAAEAMMAARTKVFILLGAVREEGSL